MSGIIGWMVGSGTLSEADAKTSPIVTWGMGCHPRYFLLGGWTVSRARKWIKPVVRLHLTIRVDSRSVLTAREVQRHGRF